MWRLFNTNRVLLCMFVNNEDNIKFIYTFFEFFFIFLKIACALRHNCMLLCVLLNVLTCFLFFILYVGIISFVFCVRVYLVFSISSLWPIYSVPHWLMPSLRLWCFSLLALPRPLSTSSSFVVFLASLFKSLRMMILDVRTTTLTYTLSHSWLWSFFRFVYGPPLDHISNNFRFSSIPFEPLRRILSMQVPTTFPTQ